MRRGAFAGAVIVAAARAHADPAPTPPPGDADARSVTERERPALLEDAEVPLLRFTPVVRPNAMSLGADEAVDHTIIALGKHTLLELDRARWENALDTPERGWRLSARLAHDVAGFKVTAAASLEHVEDRHIQRTYADVGLSIGRAVRLSRWMTAWISLSVGIRRWRGVLPPEGEADSEQVMLSIGTTFR